ncbi:MAG TPA: UbiA family prenyltransferase, partial [Candidatus Bilamarchaeaceae archaeon]|nr:UbiA family prenyltransferase [Candidatus Bilamarchaeaceae archaeon]
QAVAAGGMPPLGLVFLLALLVPALSEMGSFALNDYTDVDADRANGRADRPLVGGELGMGFALWLSVFCLLASVLVAAAINADALIIALVFNGLAVAYNLWLKGVPALGNMYIAATMAIPFIFGPVALGLPLTPTIWLIASLGFVSGLGREIVKSTEDMEGDRAAGRGKTLPVVVGRDNALAIAAALFIAFMPLAALVFVEGLRLSALSGVFFAAAELGILWVAVYAVFSKEKGALENVRKRSLLFLGLGLASLLLAAFGY